MSEPVERYLGTDLRPGAPAWGKVRSVIDSRYTDPDKVLAAFAPKTSRVYVSVKDGVSEAIQLVRKEIVPSRRGPPEPALRSVLSAARPGSSPWAMWECFLATVSDAAATYPQPPLVWATTATTSVYCLAVRTLTGVEPDMSGGYSADGARLAPVLWKRLGVRVPAASHPFIAETVYQDLHLVHADPSTRNARTPGIFSKYDVRPDSSRRLLFFGHMSYQRMNVLPGRPI
jgi:hypothetical protein